MGLYIPGTFSGNYRPQGDIADGDFVAAFEFAPRRLGNGIVHEEHAKYIAEHYMGLGLPMILNRHVATALGEIVPGYEPDAIFNGKSTNLLGRGEGTWGEITQTRRFMAERDLKNPIFVAQAFHVGRVAVQAEKQDIKPIIPAGLPKNFDPESKQVWTKNRFLWDLYEPLAELVLRRQNQL